MYIYKCNGVYVCVFVCVCMVFAYKICTGVWEYVEHYNTKNKLKFEYYM